MADLLRVGGATSSRHEIVALSTTTLLRGRLVALLRQRFEQRLVVIQAGAGFGKSTLLAQAVRENRLEQLGIDVVLRVVESDRDPAQLLGDLGTALGLSDGDVTVDRLADAVWGRAPEAVALVVDVTRQALAVVAGTGGRNALEVRGDVPDDVGLTGVRLR